MEEGEARLSASLGAQGSGGGGRLGVDELRVRMVGLAAAEEEIRGRRRLHTSGSGYYGVDRVVDPLSAEELLSVRKGRGVEMGGVGGHEVGEVAELKAVHRKQQEQIIALMDRMAAKEAAASAAATASEASAAAAASAASEAAAVDGHVSSSTYESLVQIIHEQQTLIALLFASLSATPSATVSVSTTPSATVSTPPSTTVSATPSTTVSASATSPPPPQPSLHHSPTPHHRHHHHHHRRHHHATPPRPRPRAASPVALETTSSPPPPLISPKRAAPLRAPHTAPSTLIPSSEGSSPRVRPSRSRPRSPGRRHSP